VATDGVIRRHASGVTYDRVTDAATSELEVLAECVAADGAAWALVRESRLALVAIPQELSDNVHSGTILYCYPIDADGPTTW